MFKGERVAFSPIKYTRSFRAAWFVMEGSMRLGAKLLKSSFLFSLGLLASAYTVCPQANAQSVGDRNIIIRLDEIQINDEDDDITNDEPYLVVVKFRFLYGSEASTLSVSTVRGRIDSLHHCCNWADEGNRYAIAPPHINEYVPGGEDWWIVGAAIVHMENDAFDNRIVATMSTALRDAIDKSIRTMTDVDRKG